MLIKLGNVVLAGETPKRDAIGLKINGTRAIGEQDFFRIDYPDLLNKRGRRTVITFGCIRVFGTMQEAENFMVNHEAEVPILDVLQIQSSDNTATNWYPNAGPESIACEQNGCSVTTQYVIKAGKPQKTKPTT